MKYTEQLFYYPISENKLLVNTAAFQELESHIEYALVSCHQDVYVLEHTCYRTQLDWSRIIRNGQTMETKHICGLCVNRLKWVAGTACSDLTFIKKEKYNDFSYLTSLLVQKKAQLDAELAVYVEMHSTPYLDNEQSITDMTYKEYRSLLSFFTKLNDRLEHLHRLRYILGKFFR